MFSVEEEKEFIELLPLMQDFTSKIKIISEFVEKEENEVIEMAFTTFFGKTLKPRYKDYGTIYLEQGRKISGCMIRMEEKGRNPRVKTGTHGMPQHIEMMFETFGSREIGKNILEYSFRLVDITLESIFSSDKEKKKEKYNLAIQQSNFLYMMLQIAVKLLALDLYKKGEKIENVTLRYMTEMIEKDKKRLGELFSEAFNGFGDLTSAIDEYYFTLNSYFEDYAKRKFNVTLEEMERMGEEHRVLKRLGEDNVLRYVGFLLERLRNKLIIQHTMTENKIITLK
ncbi:hypothetical protein [Pseudoleptotrichia goodfellowii]|uniref:Uncharacterized protein n=1 Tax=Pseudoleptotrichia goodfellowii TaxID=157692 RepID=A0A510JBA4_9FUSO|nr:hypothetical protein [Pseudoleptotrichia goodfellowii]BBM35413.1 hypothetical protein JCM16774_0325 [Pseudoleptotrichia goodfellowii]